MPKLPSPYTPAIESAIYKQQPTDFIVHEKLGIECSHTGETSLASYSKDRMNTNFCRQSCCHNGQASHPQGCGILGLKDRHALTTQWFSLRLPKKLPLNKLWAICPDKLAGDETLEILAQHWHHKNWVAVLMRPISLSSPHATWWVKAAIEQQLATIKTQAFPIILASSALGKMPIILMSLLNYSPIIQLG